MVATTACTGASHSGKLPGVVLDQDADEALERAEDGAVDHHRRVLLAIRADIEGAEPLRQVESTWKVPHCQSRPMASRRTNSSFGP